MGKKGAKRKTRWRTLSIGTPPDEEDDEEELKNGYVRGQENGTNSRPFDRNGQTGYKPRRTGTGTTTSGYTSGSSRSRRDDSTGSPSQPKIIFNEEEYTRITTPRQDVLFKKGYLSQKKPWTSTASTSATPSTTESQSASHSTADGSETTEDQQLLDSGTGEYPPVVEPAAQLGYGTFYDHASGYYYEYPVMLVGPPMPEQVEPNCLAAMSCGPVPLRPIEWVNPAFVPKLAGQQFCYTDYQSTQSVDCAAMVDAQGTMVAEENSTLNGNESCAGSASCNGSVVGEDVLEQTEEPTEELPVNEVPDGYNGPFIETTLMPPMHITPVVQPLPQPYMYPGHYMFGPSLVNVNGVTIQSGPMVRYSDVMATTTSVTCAKWRRKKRKRKQKRPPALGNTEDEEEEEYSSECENGTTRPPWTANSSTTTTTNRPLNPECQEFQLRSIAELQQTKAGPTTPENSVVETTSNPPSNSPTPENSILSLTRDSLTSDGKVTPDSITTMLNDCPSNRDESKRLTEFPSGFLKETSANETDGGTTEPTGASDTQESTLHDSSNLQNPSNHISPNLHTFPIVHNSPKVHGSSNGDLKHEERERLSKDTLSLKLRINGIKEPEEDLSKLSKVLTSLEITPHGDEKPRSRPASPEINRTTTPINAETQRLPESYESLVTRPVAPPRRKYSSKNAKFVREPTPGPDLSSEANPEVENLKGENSESKKVEEDQRHNCSLESCNENTKASCERFADVSNEDSGFENQTQIKHEDPELEVRVKFEDRGNLEGRVNRPITEAVTEWLRKANSPDLFITSNLESDSESEQDGKNLESKPPKNLQRNPIPALSANGSVNNESLLRLASCGEFARTNKKIGEQLKSLENQSAIPRRKRNSKNNKKKNITEKTSKNEDKNLEKILKKKKHLADKTADCNENIRIVNSGEKCSSFVGDCEFTEEDSDAGVRVASNSRINEEMKTLRVQGPEEKDEDPATVRTFEKGEIVVSIDGKLLPVTKFNYEPVLCGGKIFSEEQTERFEKDKRKSVAKENQAQENEEKSKQEDSEETEIEENEMEASIGSIEEPDVLECWEAETLEPVASPRRLLRSKISFHEGEAAEDDDLDSGVEHVKKYYRLARESVTTSGTSVEEEKSEENMNSGTVPNSPESLQSEEIPVFVSAEKQRIPIDEAFEVYESCYNGSQYITLDPRFRKRSMYGREDGPIPCKAVCCNIQ